jgi:hypothetical protein
MSYEYIKIETKICTTCNFEKNITEFEFRNDRNKYKTKCKICVKIKNDEYREKNKDSINEKNREYSLTHKEEKKITSQIYYINNKNIIDENNKIYRKNNRDKINKAERIRSVSKRKNDPIYKLRKNTSRSVNSALKANEGSKRGNSVVKFLPYTIEELKIYLEIQFETWMNWDNYGVYKEGGERKWHIDHIIPQSLLPYDSMDHHNFQKSWVLSNLRPLEAAENMAKHNKISDELYNETMTKINLELDMRAENNPEFKIKLEKWRLEEELDNYEQLKKVG